ncbi:MAG: hypothetical protein V7K69_29870 [Nostoc sp.]|uniref:hypothetical protein n=1 Tax=Nostoc sp. TaxID=1180 RepID=UPI002FF65D6F
MADELHPLSLTLSLALSFPSTGAFLTQNHQTESSQPQSDRLSEKEIAQILRVIPYVSDNQRLRTITVTESRLADGASRGKHHRYGAMRL